MSKKYYIASKLENHAQVRELKAILDQSGWEHTYDWTVHGSVQSEGAERIAEVASAEAEGVCYADAIIVLLPGGRGTHAELGMAIGQTHLGREMEAAGIVAEVERRICIYSPDPDKDFGTGGTTCAFYHHPYVERFTSIPEMIDSLLKVN
jgi:hypothetical protein